ncbi:MAG: BatD family protein [Candidatus Methanofastidiosum sp.]|nr:BatD family protein [Methanofastidiosum sp.]
MKKIFAILTSLLFIVSVFGVASAMEVAYSVVAAPETVKVGELITVTTNYNPGKDPTIIADGDKPKGDAELVSRPNIADECGLEPAERTWIYRATAPGTIRFDFSPPATSTINGNTRVSNPVKITSNSLPMLNFMKILGFGNESA